ncbi:hypothetical protein [Legionella sp. 31fI33]|nr:hypothetical protein [Legionella sp. 31fI33]MCC5015795.1 hypothetical protein [Legionella sp. 31fI33]
MLLPCYGWLNLIEQVVLESEYLDYATFRAPGASMGSLDGAERNQGLLV